MIEPEPLQQLDRTYVRFRRRKLSYFSGCDYFRLSSHPRVMAALDWGLRHYGLNVAASRLTTGNHALYGTLERELARFFGAPSALVVSSGYATNPIAAQALAGNFSHALIDSHAHPALADAARFLDCPVLQFRHADPDHLAATVRRCGPDAKLVVLTDGLFARDGAVAPLRQYLERLPKDALMLVDDAHGAGVVGPTGRGSLEHHGLSHRQVIQTLTLSKALGAYGGAILGPRSLRRRILKHSRWFVGSTPPPLPLAQAALEAVHILSADRSLRQHLRQNACYLRSALRQAGLPVEETPGPIVALFPKSKPAAAKLTAALLAAGIYPPFLRYPTAPASGYFRFVISSEHSRAQLDDLVSVLRRARSWVTALEPAKEGG